MGSFIGFPLAMIFGSLRTVHDGSLALGSTAAADIFADVVETVLDAFGSMV